MITKEEVERQTQAMNAFRFKAIASAVVCAWCGGDGRHYEAIFGDPAMGFADAGSCGYCKGTGQDNKTRLRL
jgi:hypothetical protein